MLFRSRIGRTGRAGAEGLAISFASPNDTKLVGDIEKLTKQKIELLGFEFDDERPVGRMNHGRRHWRDDDDQEDAHPVAASARSRFVPPAKVHDPFFDRPYEPDETATPVHAPAEPVIRPRGSSISPNIKPKRKVAALFKASS